MPASAGRPGTRVGAAHAAGIHSCTSCRALEPACPSAPSTAQSDNRPKECQPRVLEPPQQQQQQQQQGEEQQLPMPPLLGPGPQGEWPPGTQQGQPLQLPGVWELASWHARALSSELQMALLEKEYATLRVRTRGPCYGAAVPLALSCGQAYKGSEYDVAENFNSTERVLGKRKKKIKEWPMQSYVCSCEEWVDSKLVNMH